MSLGKITKWLKLLKNTCKYLLINYQDHHQKVRKIRGNRGENKLTSEYMGICVKNQQTVCVSMFWGQSHQTLNPSVTFSNGHIVKP